MLFRKAKAAEVAFYAVLVLAAAFMLWQALKLDLVVRGAIGPGLYPALVLGALLAGSIVLLVQAATSREVRLLSPFLEGLQHDMMLRRLAGAADGLLGTSVRVVANTGSGWFSALHAGRRAPPDGETVVVVTSETPDLRGPAAAAFCLDQLDPIVRLWFDPDVVVARADAPWSDLPGLFGDCGRDSVRIGFVHGPEEAESILRWIVLHHGRQVTPAYHSEAKVLLRHLRDGQLDVAVLSLAEAEGDLGRGVLRSVAVLASEATGGGTPLTTAAAQGYPMVSGRWAGLAVPRGRGTAPARAVERLHAAFSQAFLRLRTSGGIEEGEAWSVAPPAAFTGFLAGLRAQWASLSGGTVNPAMPRGKVVGLAAAVFGVLFFPQIMDLMGFPLAVFLFLSILMALLWPSVEARAGLTIVPVAVGVSLVLYLLFADLFYVVFPTGSLWGG